MYAVNCSIPKTLVRYLVGYLARDNAEKDEALHDVLEDILATPVSPELLPAVQGQISQRTEDLVGPYELHDFFLYYMLRWGFSPRKDLPAGAVCPGPAVQPGGHFEMAEGVLSPLFLSAV